MSRRSRLQEQVSTSESLIEAHEELEVLLEMVRDDEEGVAPMRRDVFLDLSEKEDLMKQLFGSQLKLFNKEKVILILFNTVKRFPSLTNQLVLKKNQRH